jgi:hypothetical protein
MATVQIYNQGDDRQYTVTFALKSTLLKDQGVTGENDYYIDVSTTLTFPNKSSFGHFVVRDLSDVPPGYPVATDFSNLCSSYISYFMDQSELVYSSSSSSNSSSSSSSNSSSSSSSQSESSSSSQSV